MELQYISDSSGKRVAVIIPIEKWNDIIAKYEDIRDLINKPEQKKPSDY
jgi:hypothetical protein